MIRSYFKTPKGYLLASLLVLTAIAAIGAGSAKSLLHTAIAVGTAVLVDMAFTAFRSYKLRFPDGALLTGLICALVLSDTSEWWITVTACGVAILSKHIIKSYRKPVFNPAAFGLWVVLLFPNVMQSWWGGLSLVPVWCSVFLLLIGYAVTYRVKKFPLVFAFMFIYIFTFLILGILHTGNAAEAVRSPFINSALFLTFFMLTDPPTSPSDNRGQIVFGVVASIISVTICIVHGGLTYLFAGVLMANAWHAWMRTKKRNAPQSRGRFV